MPSPSKLHLILGLTATAGLLYGGAWFAAGVGTPAEDAHSEENRVMPSMAPIPNIKPESNNIKASTSMPSQPKVTESTSPSPSPLSITVSGVRNTNGKVLVLVFDEKQGFDSSDYSRSVGYAELQAKTSPMSHTFQHLRGGPYAISMFHDENNNQNFDMAGGMPQEGYGTSGASGPYDQVSFEKALKPAGKVSMIMWYLN